MYKSTDACLVSSLGNHKIRWDRTNRIFVDGEEIDEEGETQKTMQEAVYEEEYREVYNRQTKTLSFRNIRPSQVKNNPRVVFSKPKHQKEEQEFATRDTMVQKEFRNYVSSKGESPKPITASEARGIKKLQKRVAGGSITICETDKSSGIAIMSRESVGVSRGRPCQWRQDHQLG